MREADQDVVAHECRASFDSWHGLGLGTAPAAASGSDLLLKLFDGGLERLHAITDCRGIAPCCFSVLEHHLALW